MSGGVDSAVAAARAVDAGHDVTGVHLALARNPHDPAPWPHHAATELLGELDGLFDFLPRRGLPPQTVWGCSQPVRHLFSYPLFPQPAFDFGRWRALMTHYGI